MIFITSRFQSPCRNSLMKIKSQRIEKLLSIIALILEPEPMTIIIPNTQNSETARKYAQSSTHMTRLYERARATYKNQHNISWADAAVERRRHMTPKAKIMSSINSGNDLR